MAGKWRIKPVRLAWRLPSGGTIAFMVVRPERQYGIDGHFWSVAEAMRYIALRERNKV